MFRAKAMNVASWPASTFRCGAADLPHLGAKQQTAAHSDKLSGAMGKPSVPSALRQPQ